MLLAGARIIFNRFQKARDTRCVRVTRMRISSNIERPSFEAANTDPHFAPFCNNPAPPARACVRMLHRRSFCKKFKKTFFIRVQSLLTIGSKYQIPRIIIILSILVRRISNLFFEKGKFDDFTNSNISLFSVPLGVGKNLEEMDCVTFDKYPPISIHRLITGIDCTHGNRLSQSVLIRGGAFLKRAPQANAR